MLVVLVVVFVPPFVLAVVVVIVVVPPSAVTVPIAIPVMVMLESATGTVPVTPVIAAAFIVWNHPDCALIRPERPVAAVPNVAAAHRKPVAFHPRIFGFGPGANRPHGVNAR